MAQHFLLSRPAKTLSLAQVFRMTDTEAEAMFRKIRWPDVNGGVKAGRRGGANSGQLALSRRYLRVRSATTAPAEMALEHSHSRKDIFLKLLRPKNTSNCTLPLAPNPRFILRRA